MPNEPSQAAVVYLHPEDNIGIAARPVPVGTTMRVAGQEVTTAEPIRLGHKLAVFPIRKGDPVRKYGQIIGFASQPIAAGEWVHCHNLAVAEFERDPASATQIPPPPTPIVGRTFDGYRRASGKAGTRNYLAVISTVNCSASVAKYVARKF